jgi:hypothetical protein
MSRERMVPVIYTMILVFSLFLIPPCTAVGLGSLDLTSDPAGAVVILDSMTYNRAIRTPYIFTDLPEGEHRIVLMSEGYEEYRDTVLVTGGTTNQYHARLRKQGDAMPGHGTLSIMSNPYTVQGVISGSDPAVAGVTFTTPYTLNVTQPGSYTVKLTSPGYRTWTQNVNAGIGKTTYVFGDLVQDAPVNCTLSVTSFPPGAYVFLDGVFRGTTPVLFSPVTSNRHSISTEYPGYTSDRRAILLRNGTFTAIDSRLTPVSDPSIIVNIMPLGTSVLIDGEIHGTSPETFTGIGEGTHTMALHAPGYRDTVQTVIVQEGLAVTVADDMQPRPSEAALAVSAEPAGSYVYIDGFLLGTAPVSLAGIPGGEHLVEVRQSGYRTWRKAVDVAQSGTTHVLAYLHPEPVPTTGDAAVMTIPAGAVVWLDGNYIGITRADRELVIPAIQPGSHSVMSRFKTGIPRFVNFSVVPGSTKHIAIPLGSLSAESCARCVPVVVSSHPAGGDVYLDNIFKGTTPVTITDAEEGTHSVDIRLGGYLPWSRTVVVTGTTPVSVAADLQAAFILSPAGLNAVLFALVVILLAGGFAFAARIKKS